MKQLDDVCLILNEIAHSSPLDDEFGVYEMLEDITMSNIKVIMKLHQQVVPQVKVMLVAYNTAKNQLDEVNKELLAKQEQLESAKNCSQCVKLQNDLARSRKKLAVNEKRIKTIAKLLTRDIACTEDVDRDYTIDSDDSSVSKAYNLVSQMLGCEPTADSEECKEAEAEAADVAGTTVKNVPHTVEESFCENEDDIIICSLEESDLQSPQTPKKQILTRKEFGSPVLGKMKKTPSQRNDCIEACNGKTSPALELNTDESIFCIPASPCKDRSSRSILLASKSATPRKFKLKQSPKKSPKKSPRKSPHKIAKRKADFWELKTTRVNGDTDSVSGKKLKQAQLTFGRNPEIIELCSLKDFNGGLRRSQTSTQISNQAVESAEQKTAEKSPQKQCKKLEEDLILDSPQVTRTKSKHKSRVFQKLSLDGKTSNRSDSSVGSGEMRRILTGPEGKRPRFDAFDQLPRRLETSPKFKYRGDPVRKKDERKKLDGWDCDNCKKYYEACGEMTEDERKKYMNRCSRHRNKHPINTNTPPGFWDVGFPESPVLAALDQTHSDVLFKNKLKDAAGRKKSN